MINISKTNWLENDIISELVDGQHVVSFCKEAQIKNQVGLFSDEEFMKKNYLRKVHTVLYNDYRLMLH